MSGHIWSININRDKEWVVYPDLEKVSKEDLQVFDTREEAQNFVQQQSNLAFVFDYQLIERVTEALDPLIVAAIEKSFTEHPIEQEPDKNLPKGRDEEMEL